MRDKKIVKIVVFLVVFHDFVDKIVKIELAFILKERYDYIMSSIIQFTIKRDENGVYCAKAVDFPIFTSGKTLPELENNVREATALFMEDEDLASIGLSAEPSLLANFEISRTAYA
ncbi:MAG: hypothetical protein AAB661_02630 [Patescibacteria group bacterium]